MKLPRILLLSWLSLGVVFAGEAGLSRPRILYVATNGNDGWSGNSPSPSADGKDGPVATLDRARDLVREWRRADKGEGLPVTVSVRGGTYWMGRPFSLTQEDSGSAEAPVTYAAAEGERPVLSGGRLLTGWRVTSVGDRPAWVLRIPEVSEGRWSFRQLWVSGERRVRSRHPNAGYFNLIKAPESTPEASWRAGGSRFEFKEGDLRSWRSVTNAEVVLLNRWNASRLPIVEVDEASRMVRLGKRSVFRIEPNDIYYLENLRDGLDQAGEWYLDHASGVLAYLPLPGEDPETTEVVAPVAPTVMRLGGDTAGGRPVQHLIFRGLTFAHTEWNFPPGFEGSRTRAAGKESENLALGGMAQSAVEVTGAVQAQGMRECRFEECRFIRLGGYGLELGLGCQQNVVSRCEFGDLGAGGVKLGEVRIRAYAAAARDNEVSDCHIHDGGRVFPSAVGIWVGQSPGNRILHNHIHDFFHSGISLGWTWGYGPALGTNTLVAFNHVHHIGKISNGEGPILSDMGGIYTLGLQRGTVIHNNYFHDIEGRQYGGWGIYFDEGTTEIVAESNLVVRTTHGGFHQHYGRDNVVRNNILVDSRDQQVQRTRVDPHQGFTFEGNIVAWHGGALLKGDFHDAKRSLFRKNLYAPPDGREPRAVEQSWRDWTASGQDVGSSVGDPGFVDPTKGDYRLRPDSPARKLGFRPLDLDRVGVRDR